MSKLTNACFTRWDTAVPVFDTGKIQYLIAQLERTPTTHELHWQGYVEFIKPVTLRVAKKLFGDATHFEERLSMTSEPAIKYCRKDETWVGPIEGWTTRIEFGVNKIQGYRTDLKQMAEDIANGLEPDPVMMLKYPRGVALLQDRYRRNASLQNRDVKVIVHMGTPGNGKTHDVYETAGRANVFKPSPPRNGDV